MESRFGEISGEQKSELEFKLLMQNLRREKLLSYVLILVNVILLGLDAVATNLWTNESHVFARYSETHYLLLIIPAAFLLSQFLGRELKVKKLWYYRLAHWALVGAVLFFCVLLSAKNEYSDKQLFAYITAMFCIAPLILLNRLEAYIFYISSLVLFLVSTKNITLNLDLIGDTFFLAILSILAIIISNINYNSFINGFAAQNTILEKNQELKDLSALQQATFDNIPDIIMVKDTTKNLVHLNMAAKRFLNLDEEVQADVKCSDILDKRFNCENCIVKEVEETRKPVGYERYIENSDVWVEMKAYPIFYEDGSVSKVIEHIHDITSLKKAEKELQLKNEALQKSAEENQKLLNETIKYDELKSEFFSNISHEFRTPINVLLGTLQLINLQYSDPPRTHSKQGKYYGIMKQNCYRLLRLTNNLIDMTRLDSGFLTLNLANQDIVRVVEDITVSVAEYVENKGIKLIFDTDVEEKIMAVDSDKIERVLLNLLSNAVKFTRENGKVWVNIRDFKDGIEISVKDTGIGIPESKLDMIFERFRQVNSSFTRSNEGSGIGLSLVKNLVELHGGRITVKSEIDRGSEFIIRLPAKLDKDDEASKPFNVQNHVERISIEFSDIYSL